MNKLWTLIILVGLFAWGCINPILPNDLWWHARVGDEILNSGHIPHYDVYSLTEQGQPFFYQSWLAEVIMAGLIRLGGVRLLVFSRALIMTSLFGTVLLLCRQIAKGDRRIAIPPAIAAIWMGLGNQTVRPQLYAYPLFMAVYILLRRYRQEKGERSVWLVPVLVIVWVNMHGSFALGLGMIWLTLIGELLSSALPTLSGRQASAQANAAKRLMTLGLVALFSTVVILLNPRGVDIIGYVADLLTDVPSQMLGQEWQPPNPKQGLGQFFYLFFLWVIATLALARPSIALTDLLLVLAFAWLGATGIRYVVWVGLVSAPILVEALSRLPTDDLAHWRDRLAGYTIGQRLLYGDGGGYRGFRWLALAGTSFSVLMIGWLFLFCPDDNWSLDDHTGIAAVEFMQENNIQGRLFNELGQGSYLIWQLGPAQPVFIDPRFELYPMEHFENYITISRARKGAQALLDEYDFEWLLLNRYWQKPLVEFITDQAEHWELVYDDDYDLLYRRVKE